MNVHEDEDANPTASYSRSLSRSSSRHVFSHRFSWSFEVFTLFSVVMAFWKPGTAAPGIGVGAGTLDREAEQEPAFAISALKNLSIYQQRVQLPIYEHRMLYRFFLSYASR